MIAGHDYCFSGCKDNKKVRRDKGKGVEGVEGVKGEVEKGRKGEEGLIFEGAVFGGYSKHLAAGFFAMPDYSGIEVK